MRGKIMRYSVSEEDRIFYALIVLSGSSFSRKRESIFFVKILYAYVLARKSNNTLYD